MEKIFRHWAILSISILLVWVFAFLSQAEAGPQGKIVVALSSDVSTLDTQNHNIRIDYIIGWHLYDNLVMRNQKTLKIEPHLAESWKILDDNTWEFKLRKGHYVRQRGTLQRRMREI